MRAPWRASWWSLQLGILLGGCSEVAEVLTPSPSASAVDVGMPDAAPDASDGDATVGIDAKPDAGETEVQNVMVAAGSDHTCATVSGALYCWGRNQRGKLGLGDSQNRLMPARVGSLDLWVEVAAGSEHSCARRAAGEVFCFGANDAGQLGSPGVNDVLGPISVALPAPALVITTESRFSCAVLDAGSLYCWGENTEGMLGQDDSYPGQDAFSPQRVGEHNDFTSADAGQGHACAIRRPGQLWCWGRNSDHQLGLGDQAAAQFRVAQRVGDQTDWIGVSAGQGHSCGLSADGALWCWGDNEFGNLGTGDREPRSVPVEIAAGNYVEVSVDTFHGCALDASGGLWCWGRNVEGQLGLGDYADRVAPTRIDGSDWVQVSVGRFHTCAKRLDGGIWCTGENAVGELGLGDVERRNEMTRVSFPDE